MQRIAAITLCASLTASATAQYAITDLGPLFTQDTTTSPGTVALDMNDAGAVAGYAVLEDFAPSFYGAVWSPSGLPLEPMPGDIFAAATAINNTGQIAGVSYNLGDIQRTAVLWTGATPTPIGTFTPTAINNAGLIVGSRERSPLDPTREAILRATDGTLTLLPPLGTRSAAAKDINTAGDIVGQSQNGMNNWRATLWRNNIPTDLGTLGGARSQALAISDANHVVGVSLTAAGATHAFRYDLAPDGSVETRHDLLPLNNSSAHAYDVNASGTTVGVSDSRAVRWDTTTPIDLNTQIGPASANWRLVKATAINESGQITGLGYLGGVPRSFLLTPASTPCPGDCDSSGAVDFNDLVAALFQFGQPTPGPCDCDNSGAVDFNDLVCALFLFGPCPE